MAYWYKIFIILFLLCGPCFSGEFIINPFSTFGDGSACTPCAWIETNVVYGINFDYSATCGTPTETEQRTGCSTISGTLSGALTTATIVAGPAGANTSGNAIYGDGTDNQAAYMTVSNAGGELNSAEGSVELWIYPTDSDDDNQFFFSQAESGETGYMRAWIEADGDTVKFYFSGGSLSDLVTTNQVVLNAWNYIKLSWNVALNMLRVELNSTLTTKSDVAITAFSAEPLYFYIGNFSTVYELGGYIDNFQIYPNDDLLD